MYINSGPFLNYILYLQWLSMTFVACRNQSHGCVSCLHFKGYRQNFDCICSCCLYLEAMTYPTHTVIDVQWLLSHMTCCGMQKLVTQICKHTYGQIPKNIWLTFRGPRFKHIIQYFLITHVTPNLVTVLIDVAFLLPASQRAETPQCDYPTESLSLSLWSTSVAALWLCWARFMGRFLMEWSVEPVF